MELLKTQRHALQEIIFQNSTEGKPFTLIQRSIVQKRAEDENKSFPFGTEIDYYQKGREWIKHSAFPRKPRDEDFRIIIGSSKCVLKYNASILNIGAMSYGSISSAATEALNGGAKIGGFAQNIGEGGLTPYHEKFGADLIFQIGTGYFG